MDLLARMQANPGLRPYCPPLTDATMTVVEWRDQNNQIVDANVNEPSRYPDPK
jgi:hypothetical protein